MLRLGAERPVLRVVADQIGSPTSARDIAAAICTIVQQLNAGNSLWGTYHFAGAGAVSWHGFAEAIFALASQWNSTGREPPPRVEAITTADYPTPARRLPGDPLTVVIWTAHRAAAADQLLAASRPGVPAAARLERVLQG